jgi:Phytanoyl-CoA dioxygenase (PhyH)
MNAFDRYRFDLQGFIVLRGVLDPDEVRRAARAFEWALEETPRQDRHTKKSGEIRLENLLAWGPDVVRLLDHPAVIDVLRDVVDEGFRLDHAYALWHPQGAGQIGLHGGGPTPAGGAFYTCANGRIRTGLTAVGWALVDPPPAGGGFMVVPGSHKAALEFPPEDEERVRAELAVAVPLNAGDAVVFTEAVMHGALPWAGDAPRMALFFKYAPGWAAWGGRPSALLRYTHANWHVPEGLTKRQRLILEPPYAHSRAPVL